MRQQNQSIQSTVKMNGLRPPLTALPVFTVGHSRSNSLKCRILRHKFCQPLTEISHVSTIQPWLLWLDCAKHGLKNKNVL